MTSRRRAFAVLVSWCLAEWFLRRQQLITDDWQGWRQADTLAMAQHFVEGPFYLLEPRIDWGGDGSGIVETELALVPAVVALAMRLIGSTDILWPAQLLSLVAVAAAGWLTHQELARRFSADAALLGLLAFLSVRGVVVIGTSAQPDALGLLAFAVGWWVFLRDLEAPRHRSWLIWVAATTVAGLLKPTLLSLGISQAIVALARGRPLKRPRLWLGWLVVLGVVGLYLWHARSLYLEHGNTFGLLSGGDSKLPTRARIVELGRWLDLARYAIVWGTGPLAAVAAIVTLWRRRPGVEELALALGGLAVGVVAFRYTSHKWGTHYHLPLAILGALVVARAVEGWRTPWPLRVGAVAAVALYIRGLLFVMGLPPEPETRLGLELAKHRQPGDLVVVRARAPGYEPEWETENNYQDPRVFYLSDTRGWVLPNDEHAPEAIGRLAERGARYYVHVAALALAPAQQAWLATHATLISETDAGTIYRLAPE
ncbi:MAG TPA: hypothetical protein ENK57_13820 [Polyangiaceae bacterium]|nr:hypothetical protein [Polyangiaceae bacterium]